MSIAQRVLSATLLHGRMAMEDQVSRMLDAFDANPVGVDQFPAMCRELFSELSALDETERSILDWDATGRNPDKFEQVRKAAWTFDENGEAAFRKRIFAGFVTNDGLTNGYGAKYLLDFAVGSGIAQSEACSIMFSYVDQGRQPTA